MRYLLLLLVLLAVFSLLSLCSTLLYLDLPFKPILRESNTPPAPAALFHWLAGSGKVAGTQLANRKRRDTWLDIRNTSVWSEVKFENCGVQTRHQLFNYLGGNCHVYFPSVNMNLDGNLTAGLFADEHGELVSVKLECTLHGDTHVEHEHEPETWSVVTGDNQLRSFNIEKRVFAAPPWKEQGGVICGRPVFGNFSHRALAQFVDFYVRIWNMDLIILYDVGVGSVPQELQNHPRVYVVSLSEAIEESMAHSSLSIAQIVSKTEHVAQWMARNDCLRKLQQNSYGTNPYVFFFDYDEYMFPGALAKASPTHVPLDFHDLLPKTELPVKGIRWMSFGSLLVKHRDPYLCSPESPSSLVEAKFQSTRQYHYNIEVQALITNKSRASPFYCENHQPFHACLDFRGSRKPAVSLVDPDRREGMIRIHRVSGCAYKDTMDEFGVNLHPLEHLYLRHYRCLNPTLRASRDNMDFEKNLE